MTTWSDARSLVRRASVTDPYLTLGVSPTVSDAELRRAYHRLVHLHHPDHNGGSDASTDRFGAIQQAYDEAMLRRNVDRRPQAVRAYTTAAAAAGVAPVDVDVDVRVAFGTPASPAPEHRVAEPETLQADGMSSVIPIDSARRRPWAEPWLDARITAFERVLQSRRTEQEQAYREAAAELQNESSSGARNSERRRTSRPMAEWFRGDGR